MRQWWAKVVKALSGRRGLAEDLREEIESHLEFEIEENLARGMPPEKARREARRNFGSPTLICEQACESWALRFLETLLQDLRYGVRALARNPGLTATAVLSLALGIGANSALFSVYDAVMLRTLPVRNPKELMQLSWSSGEWPGKFIDDVQGRVYRDPKTGLMTSPSFSYSTLEFLKDNNRSFSALIACSTNTSHVNVGLGGGAADAMMQAVSGDYFRRLGVAAVAGRNLEPDDDRAGAAPVAVVSYSFWRRRLGGDPDVAGRDIVVNGTPASVVGVAPREFFGIEPGSSPDLYVPLRFYLNQFARIYDYDLLQPKVCWLTLIGRLNPGVSGQQADLELKALFRRYLDPEERTASTDSATPELSVRPAGRGLDTLREGFSAPLFLLMAMVGVVLLIACANVAGLLLGRAAARRREISVRLSLGAPRLRIVRQLLTESVLLGILGGTAGLLFAAWLCSLLTALFASAQQSIVLSLRLNLPVFAFTAVISVLCGILFGMVPALRTGRTDVYQELRKSAASPVRSGRRFPSGKLLVGAQVALGLVLLVGAGLLSRTLSLLEDVDLGFEPQNLLVFGVQPGMNGYEGARLAAYYQDLQRGIAAVPGVRSVALSQRVPVADGWSLGRVSIPGYTAGTGVPFYRHWVSSGFLETVGIPLLQGRMIDSRDSTSAPRAVVVNRRFVRKYLRDEDPVGLSFDAGSFKGTIVGVVGDARYGKLRNEAPPTAYFSYLQYGRDCPESMSYLVRTASDPGATAATIRAEVAALDPEIPVVQMRTLTESIRRALVLERILALLSGMFGLLALVLACVGLYGTISYTVRRRTNEIGIRLALGARRETIRIMVLRETLAVVLGGIAVGLPLAWGGMRLLEDRLFGISPNDPVTIMTAVLIITAVGVIAGYFPARQASSIDPVQALRCE